MGKHVFVLIVLVTVFITAQVPAAIAQEPVHSKSFWLNLSAGSGSLSNHGGGDAVRMALSYEPREKIFFTLALSAVMDSEEVAPDAKVETYASALDLLIGTRLARPHLGFVSVSSGLSIVSGTPPNYRPNAYGELPRDFSTLGLPLNAQVVLAPYNWLGLGLDTFANLNLKGSYWGVGLGLYLGKMW